MSTEEMADTGGGQDISPDELLKAGILFLRKNRPKDALLAFRHGLQKQGQDPRLLSYAGYALALAEGRTKMKEAVKLCESAVRLEFYRPELFLNLGRVYLLSGNKRKAHQIFWKGYAIDKNRELWAEIEKMGVRKPPVFPFLHRSNLFNRYIGKLLYILRLR